MYSLGVLELAHVPRRNRQELVADAELRIQVHGLLGKLPRFLELAVGGGVLCRRIVADHVQRSSRETRHGKHLRGL